MSTDEASQNGGADPTGLMSTPCGFLTRDEVYGLLTEPKLLLAAALAAALPGSDRASDYLVGCVVHRQAPSKRSGRRLFARAKILALSREGRPHTADSFYWQLTLTTSSDETAEQPTCLAYIANKPTPIEEPVMDSVQPGRAAKELVAALRGKPHLAAWLKSVSTVEHLHRGCAPAPPQRVRTDASRRARRRTMSQARARSPHPALAV